MKNNLLVLIVLLFSVGAGKAYAQPVADVSYDQLRFCESGEVTLTINFTGDAPYDFKYWINNGIVDQGVVVTNHNSDIFTLPINFPNSGFLRVYDLEDVNGIAGTVNNGEGTVIVDAMPNPTIHDPIRTCDLDVHLSGSKEFETSSTIWRLGNGTVDGTLTDENSLNPVFSAIAEGNYTVYFKEIQGVCEKEIGSPINVVNKPSPSGGSISDSETICSNNQATIALDITGTFPISVSYTDGELVFLETDVKQIVTRTLIDSEIYQLFKLRDVDGCETIINQNVNISVDRTPVTDAGFFSQPVCGEEVQLGASLEDGNTGFWTIIDDHEGSGLTIENSDNPISKASLNYGAQYTLEYYTLRWTEVNSENTECVDFDEVEIEFNKMPKNVSLGNDTTVYLDKEIVFSTTGLEDMPLTWNLPEGVSVDEQEVPQVTVSGLSQGDNQVICTIENGVCPAVTAEKLIRVNDIYQTTGFSPNGDGVNETFIIGGAANVEGNKLIVFDVTGKVVFETTDFCRSGSDTEEGWNGYQNNGERKDGTYYYIFTGNGIEPIKNYLIIKGSTK